MPLPNVICHDCGSAGAIFIGLWPDLDEAWNRRATSPEVAAIIAERDELKAAAEESKTAAHARIRQGYDTVVADSWRAKVAEVEAERDRLKEEVEMLRELLADQQRAFVESLALAQTPAA